MLVLTSCLRSSQMYIYLPMLNEEYTFACIYHLTLSVVHHPQQSTSCQTALAAAELGWHLVTPSHESLQLHRVIAMQTSPL